MQKIFIKKIFKYDNYRESNVGYFFFLSFCLNNFKISGYIYFLFFFKDSFLDYILIIISFRKIRLFMILIYIRYVNLFIFSYDVSYFYFLQKGEIC